MKRKGILIALLIMAIGFASVTTTLYINGTSILKKNANDFKVYYSDALVNGNQDLSVVVDETHLSFKTTLDTLGQTYVLDYDVTNGSKNYDAALTMSCTNGNDWLTVTNSFDTSTNLEALQTRSGTLTLTLSKSYTGDDLDVKSMKEAIKYFLGEHDFRAFVTDSKEKENCVRLIYYAAIEKRNDKILITFRGNGFLRYQIRNMVGILIKVGENKISTEDVERILESKDRTTGGKTAPAQGLYLTNIEY